MRLTKKIYSILLPGAFPFSMCLVLGIFIFFYKLFNLPSPEKLAELIEAWFHIYGLWLLLIAAFIEGLFIVGMYFPGSLAIALAVYTLGDTYSHLLYIGGISFVAFLAANIINYYLGKYGYYKLLALIGKNEMIEKMHNTMNKHGYRTFFLTGFFPNFIAITSVCAGISNFSFTKTVLYQTTSLLFWVTIWTIIGSAVIKKINFEDNNQTLYLLGIIFIWGVVLIINDYVKTKKEMKSNSINNIY